MDDVGDKDDHDGDVSRLNVSPSAPKEYADVVTNPPVSLLKPLRVTTHRPGAFSVAVAHSQGEELASDVKQALGMTSSAQLSRAGPERERSDRIPLVLRTGSFFSHLNLTDYHHCVSSDPLRSPIFSPFQLTCFRRDSTHANGDILIFLTLLIPFHLASHPSFRAPLLLDIDNHTTRSTTTQSRCQTPSDSPTNEGQRG
ncbi:hypothetical protein C8F01DRAFT_1248085 [Mycena amicta]|nr:hypothetical protein C8F01DRAFT_1248085 [Mycena amicta]